MRLHTERRFLTAVLALCMLVAGLGVAAAPPDLQRERANILKFRKAEAKRWLDLHRAAETKAWPKPEQEVNVTHCDLHLAIDPAEKREDGSVTITFTTNVDLEKLTLMAHRALKVSAAALDGSAADWVRKSRKNKIVFNFDPPLAAGGSHSVTVTFGGYPKSGGSINGGMLFADHDGTPSATTLSEPFASFYWWPCIDNVADKFTMDMYLTVPETMTGASNGTLAEVIPNGDGTDTWHWVENYPIVNYLVSANVTNYARFQDTYTPSKGATAMVLDYYVYPEDLTDAVANFSTIPDMIGYFASLVGEYPFLDEKYGMVEFPWGGGMEHQTLTSMGDAYVSGSGPYNSIYSHELAHQWWGDCVTLGTWHDIWLNEGFATYFEILWLSHVYDLSESEVMTYYDDGEYNGQLGGTVYVKDASKPFADQGAIYDKGAWVLHMLRRVVGDTIFFQALNNYRSMYAYSNATTPDLQSVFETAYGQPLDWFFSEWVYTPKRPIYKVSWSQDGNTVTVLVAQKQKHKIKKRDYSRNVYIMPADITLHFQDGSSETHTVTNDERRQTFTFNVTGTIASVGFDEGGWILKVLK